MKLGYNTNGLADHSLASAIELIGNIGYDCIAITIDHHRLNPYGPRLEEELAVVKEQLDESRLASVIETGARYLLDSYHKHQPTLMTMHAESRQIRVDYLCHTIDIAAELGSECVSFWSGAVRIEEPDDTLWNRLCESLRQVIDYAAERHVTLAFEPEPGHFIDTMAGYERLLEALPPYYAEQLQLTIDIGHLHCMNEVPIVDQLWRWQDRLVNVHVDDMERGKHEHLRLGYGRIDFQAVFRTLAKISYQGPATIELPRHSHIGPEVAEESYRYVNEVLLNLYP